MALASVYAIIFALAYAAYLHRAGQWFADLPVVLAASPYLFVARALTGGAYSFAGEMTAQVVAAAAFCCALAYAGGWIVETVLRIVIGGIWRGRQAP
jgi:hypothetical protein